ncbi:hypothetical protein H2202_006146 [Exophiala xenobiotica]|nr:hypothetical protein H2202_006146 [Exophiala xenobiotica]
MGGGNGAKAASKRARNAKDATKDPKSQLKTHKVSNARPASKRFKSPPDAQLLRSMPATNTARLTKIALLELGELRLFDDSQMSSEG